MKGCLLIHGFTGSPAEVLPLAEHLRRVTDWKIQAPILPGHRSDESLAEGDWQDWTHCAERNCRALLNRCEEVYVIGFSMGGLIAAHLAVRFPIDRLVLLSAPVFTIHPQQIIEDLRTMFQDEEKRNQVLEKEWQRYRKKIKNTPIRAVFQFRKLVKNLVPAIKRIEVPVLIIQGEKDNIVQPKSAEYIYANVKSTEKDLLYLPESKHLVCHDVERKKMFRTVEKFLCRTKVRL